MKIPKCPKRVCGGIALYLELRNSAGIFPMLSASMAATSRADALRRLGERYRELFGPKARILGARVIMWYNGRRWVKGRLFKNAEWRMQTNTLLWERR